MSAANNPDSTPRPARFLRSTAALLALAYFLVAGSLLSSYGPTWDPPMGEMAYGERLFAYLTSGDDAFLDFTLTEPAPPVADPHPDFTIGRFHWYQLYPFAGLISGASCRLFWTELGWATALEAHHGVIPAFVAILLYVLVVWVGRRAGLLAGVAAGLFTVLSPRFFAHSFNNLKDVPEACLYTFAMLAAFRALCGGRARWWVVAGLMTGCALAQKPNALFLPFEMGLFFAAAALLRPWREARVVRWQWIPFALGSAAFLAAYFAVSPRFWEDPFSGLREHFGEIFLVGNIHFTGFEDLGPHGRRTGHEIFAGWWHVLWTTPPLLLALSLFGVFVSRVPSVVRLFLVVAVIVPIGRTALPGMRNFDGVRHFIEFVPPLCALAGIGLVGVLAQLRSWIPSGHRAIGVTVCTAAMLAVLVPTVRTHPNGICYYNAIGGGLDGARARGVEDATDYWCNSYWQGMDWLNAQAPSNAGLFVPVAGHVVQSAAPVKLRADLRLDDPTAEVLYVMYITRPRHYGPFLRSFDVEHAPDYEIRVDDAAILRIHRLDAGSERDRWFAIFAREIAAQRAQQRMFAWLIEDPAKGREVFAALADFEELGEEEVVARIQAVLPDSLDADAPEVVWLMRSG